MLENNTTKNATTFVPRTEKKETQKSSLSYTPNTAAWQILYISNLEVELSMLACLVVGIHFKHSLTS